MRMKIRSFVVVVMVLCLGATMFIGCGNNAPAAPAEPAAPAPAEPAAPAPAEPAAPAADPIVLRVAHHEPPTSPFHLAFEEFDRQLQEKTNGAARLEIYPAEQLGKGADMVSMIVNGVTDIGWIVAAFFPGQFPISEVHNLPMMGIPGSKVGAKSLWDLYQETPKMQEEFSQGMRIITFTSSGYQFISTVSKRVEVPADIKGLGLRVAGANPSKGIELIGGAPVGMPPPDMYEALDKGVIDGCVFDWMGMNSFKLTEVLHYSMNMPFVSVPQCIAINEGTWNSLPADIQDALMEIGGANGTQLFGEAFDSSNGPVSAAYKELEGREVVEISADQKAEWIDAVKPVWDGWVSDMDGKGYDGQAILDKYRSIVEKNAK